MRRWLAENEPNPSCSPASVNTASRHEADPTFEITDDEADGLTLDYGARLMVMRRTILMGVFVLLTLAGCGGGDDDPDRRAAVRGQAQQFEPEERIQVLMKLGAVSDEGSPEACIEDQLRKDLPMQEAIAACAVEDPPASDRPGRGFPAGFLSGGGTAVAAAGCESASFSNPAAEDGFFNWLFGIPTEEEEKAQTAREASDAYKAWTEQQRAADEAKAAGAADAAVQQNRADQLFEGYQDKVGYQTAQLGKALYEWERDMKLGGKGGKKPGGEQTSAQQVCAETASFISECNENGWTTTVCRTSKLNLNSCGPQELINPAPDSEGNECGKPDIDPKTVEPVLALQCQMGTKPAPGEDPCSARAVGQANTYYLRRPGDDDATPCGDPAAMTGVDQCLGTFTVIAFGERELATKSLCEAVGTQACTLVAGVPQTAPPGGPQPGA